MNIQPFLSVLALLSALAPVLVETWRPTWAGTAPASPVWLLVPLASFLAIFILPRRLPGEPYGVAVRGAVISVFSSPLTYVALALLLVLAVPLFNVGLCPSCDAQAIRAGASAEPPFRYLPSCVNAREHLSVFRWFASAMGAVLAVVFGIRRKWKLVFCEVLCWNAAVAALYGFFRLIADGTPVGLNFSVFGYPNQGGSFFAFAFALSLGLWAMRQAEVSTDDPRSDGVSHPFFRRNYAAVPAGLNLLGALATLSRAAMMFVVLLAAVFFLYVVVASLTGKRRIHRIQGLSAVLVMLAIAVLVSIYAPPELMREFKTLTAMGIADRATGRDELHGRVATAIMRDHPLFGIGGWGYRHLCPAYLTEAEQSRAKSPGSANVHNDYLQFVAEHGILGFGLMAAVFVLLVKSIAVEWYSVYLYYRFTPLEKAPVSPIAVFSVNPMVFFATLGCLCVLLHALGDCPLRSSAVLVTLFAALAAMTEIVFDEKPIG